MSATPEKLEAFRAVLEVAQIADLHARDLACEANLNNAKCKVKIGRKYANVDVGNSGKYMVELDTGNIFSIKAYGVIHRGHAFGNLDTIDQFDWSR